MLLLTISDSYIILTSRRGVIITCPIQSLYSERKMAMFNVTVDNIIEATADRKPDFSNLLKVLHRETPDRPTLFEFFLNPVLEQKFSNDLLNRQKTNRNITLHMLRLSELPDTTT